MTSIRERYDAYVASWGDLPSIPPHPMEAPGLTTGLVILDLQIAVDKIEGLEEDLRAAVEVAFKRGATEWTRLNYPADYKRLMAQR